jgi:hypothetical protein
MAARQTQQPTLRVAEERVVAASEGTSELLFFDS